MSKPLKNTHPLLAILPLDILQEVVLDAYTRGIHYRRSTHPRALVGWLGYGERVALLRERLDPNVWEPYASQNQEGVQTRDGTYRLLTMSGGPGTGILGIPPRVRRKGIKTADALKRNLAKTEFQGSMFPQADEPQANQPLTFVMLVHVEGTRIRAELALPVGRDSDATYDYLDCLERLPFLDADVGPGEAVAEDGEEIDFDIDEV